MTLSQPAQNHPHDSRRQFLRRSLTVSTAGIAALALLNGDMTMGQAPAPAARPLTDPRSGIAGIKHLLTSSEPLTWVITGDSITHGALHTLGWRSYPEHFAERIRWEMRRVRDVVINTGISGNRTRDLLKDFTWRAARFQPDVVSIMLGMNDCVAGSAGRDTFRSNLKDLAERTIAAGAIPLLHTPNTIYLKNAGSRSDLPAYATIVREVALERKYALVDHWAHWQTQKPDQEALLTWLEDKSIHPGVFGHREFAKLMFRELGIYDEKSPTCKLEAP
ncbi:MAG: SGNH/GDSL hydrolase family protein [Pirellulales bacterium]